MGKRKLENITVITFRNTKNRVVPIIHSAVQVAKKVRRK